MLTPCPEIPLSIEGTQQAVKTGQFLKSFYEELNRELKQQWEEECKVSTHCAPVPPVIKPRIWSSSYHRARLTAQLIRGQLGELANGPVNEHVRTCVNRQSVCEC